MSVINTVDEYAENHEEIAKLRSRSVDVDEMYDFFEEITERSFADASAMMIIAGKDGNAYYLRITTDSAADVSDLMSDTVTAEKDTDGETRITLRLPEGGESA